MFPLGSTRSRNSAENPAYFNRFNLDGFGIDFPELKDSEEEGPRNSLLEENIFNYFEYGQISGRNFVHN